MTRPKKQANRYSIAPLRESPLEIFSLFIRLFLSLSLSISFFCPRTLAVRGTVPV